MSEVRYARPHLSYAAHMRLARLARKRLERTRERRRREEERRGEERRVPQSTDNTDTIVFG